MTMRCLTCGAPERVARFAWRGYYRVRCANGHRSKLATPKQAAKNWSLLRPWYEQ